MQTSLESWPAYENYSGNLSIQTLTDILYTHFGPDFASQELSGYGQWTRADATSVGMDRTVWNGTDYSGQNPPEIYSMYENITTTPDNLLLWFHHVPWSHILKSGISVIQHFYDVHYSGTASAQTFVSQWKFLVDKIDNQRYNDVLFRQEYQAGHSIWCNMHKTASNRTAVVTATNSTVGTASHTVKFPTGTHDVGVNYFDLYGGISNYTLYLNGHALDSWLEDLEVMLGHEETYFPDGNSNMRKTFYGVKVANGNEIKVVGVPNGMEAAPLDDVVLLLPGVVDRAEQRR